MGGLNGALTQPAETTAAAHAAARIPVRFMMRIVWLVFRPGPFAGTDVQYATDPARPSIAREGRTLEERLRIEDRGRELLVDAEAVEARDGPDRAAVDRGLEHLPAEQPRAGNGLDGGFEG